MRRSASAALAIALAACASGGQSGSKPPSPPDRATVTSADLINPNESIESALQKKVPGLRVRRTSTGEIALEIRGRSSINRQSDPPLFILNGVPFTPGPEGALTGVDPYDIETIKVLTPTESALYGVDGASGVILITTKKGKSRGA